MVTGVEVDFEGRQKTRATAGLAVVVSPISKSRWGAPSVVSFSDLAPAVFDWADEDKNLGGPLARFVRFI